MALAVTHVDDMVLAMSDVYANVGQHRKQHPFDSGRLRVHAERH